MSSMRRLLIANRGEIALRIARSARERGLESVAVHAPEDATLAAGYGTDTIVPLAGRGAGAYLDVADLIRVAKASGCDALHPGYGFLSESADLARACADAGIVFVGPSPRPSRSSATRTRPANSLRSGTYRRARYRGPRDDRRRRAFSPNSPKRRRSC